MENQHINKFAYKEDSLCTQIIKKEDYVQALGVCKRLSE